MSGEKQEPTPDRVIPIREGVNVDTDLVRETTEYFREKLKDYQTETGNTPYSVAIVFLADPTKAGGLNVVHS